MGWDLSEWMTLVQDRRFLGWLVKEPTEQQKVCVVWVRRRLLSSSVESTKGIVMLFGDRCRDGRCGGRGRQKEVRKF